MQKSIVRPKRNIFICWMVLGLLVGAVGNLYAQDGVLIDYVGSTRDASAVLDVRSSSQGFLAPRVALTATNAAGPISSPANGLMVYNTATAGTVPNNVTPGYYYWEGSWKRFINTIPAIIGGTGTTDHLARWTPDGSTLGIGATRDNGARVGIGAAPHATYQLQVGGDVLLTSGWLRTTGSTGWYNETHAGGWYMTDATWIRTYNGKSIYQNTGTMRTDGTLQVGNSGATLNVPSGGNFSYRTDVLFANTAGNVGIGNAAPDYKLEVTGTGKYTGILTTATPTLNAAVSDLGYDAPIAIPEVNTGSGGFVPMIQATTLITGGYRKHVNIGTYRTGSGWNGGIYLAQGGNDSYPTEYFLLGNGGSLDHSSGNISTSGTIRIAGGSPAAGRVLQSDASGNATWVDASTLSVTGDNLGNHIATSGIKRNAHNTGFLEGSYNNIGDNSTYTNPIYTIGSSYNPTTTALSNMYGIGYTHTNAAFITDPGPDTWGMYVAADGDARIWLGASAGASSYFNAGNVGIGTASPSTLLHVSSTTSAPMTVQSSSAESDINYVNSAGGNWEVGTNNSGNGTGSNHFYIYDSGYRLTVQAGTGNVGVGTTAPAAKLHVDGGDIRLNDASNVAGYTLKSYSTGSSLWMLSGNTSNSQVVVSTSAHDWDRQISLTYTPGTTGSAAGDLQIGQISKNNANWTHGITRFYTNGTERMRIDNAGDVGMGTTNPLAQLHVKNGKTYMNKNNTDPQTANYANADLVIGDNTSSRSGYTGGTGSHIFLQSNDKSTITALDESNNLGQIAYQNLKWTIGEDIGWGTQSVVLPNLAGTGNRMVIANATGTLSTQTIPNAAGEVASFSSNIKPSPDDLTNNNIVTGDDAISVQNLGFNFNIGGVTYTQVTICTNGYLVFGNVSIASSDWTNTCLPTSKYNNPMVCAYWDDLQTEDDHIDYETAGSVGGRTFTVQGEAYVRANSGDVNWQIVIHEGGMITVRYFPDMSPASCGQDATIGFQTAGGSSAKAYSISCNARVIDDNDEKDQGWSVFIQQ
jgi:hypothetical protein